MKVDNLSNMVRGWFVGNFDPNVVKTSQFEVAVQHFKAGDIEQRHHHKVATEITVIVSGEAEMFGKRWTAGSIITVEPGESTGFVAITDVTTTVVKSPSVIGDKYLD